MAPAVIFKHFHAPFPMSVNFVNLLGVSCIYYFTDENAI